MQKALSPLQDPQFKLKLFLWLVFTMLTVWMCGALWLMCWAMEQAFANADVLDEEDLPASTRIVFGLWSGGGWIVVLLPWFAFPVASALGRKVSAKSCLVYTASAALVAALVLLVSLLAGFLLPFISANIS